MRKSAAARRYARALFALAKESGRIEDTRSELDALASVLDRNAELRESIFRPVFPAAERRAVLGELFGRLGTSEAVRKFCNYLVDQRRIVELEAIQEEYGRLADEAAGRRQARVVSASPLSDDQRERLRRALRTRTGHEVDLDVDVDPALLGGAIATVGTLVFDGSLRTQLTQLRASLTKGQ